MDKIFDILMVGAVALGATSVVLNIIECRRYRRKVLKDHSMRTVSLDSDNDGSESKDHV